MKIIVGLGNPGKKYKDAFHNVGFRAVDAFCNKNRIESDFKENKKFVAEVLETELNSEKIIFAKPLTFMNKSGEAVSKIINFYKNSLQNLTVLHDDLDIELGKIKVSFARGAAGHRGIESIIQHLGTNEFNRIRIGIKKENLKMTPEMYVLSSPGFFEKRKLKKGTEKAVFTLQEILEKSIEAAMAKFN